MVKINRELHLAVFDTPTTPGLSFYKGFLIHSLGLLERKSAQLHK